MHLAYDLNRTWEENCEQGPSVAIVRQVKECIKSDSLNLQIAAVGGASTTRDVADFFEAGADAVLCGSSPMYVPNLAIECKRLHPEW